MIDMVVHRHKLRGTLANLCGVLMDGSAHAASRAREVNAPLRVNGSHPGPAASRGGKKASMPDARALVIDAEPVGEDERVDAKRFFGGQGAAKDKTTSKPAKGGAAAKGEPAE